MIKCPDICFNLIKIPICFRCLEEYAVNVQVKMAQQLLDFKCILTKFFRILSMSIRALFRSSEMLIKLRSLNTDGLSRQIFHACLL